MPKKPQGIRYYKPKKDGGKPTAVFQYVDSDGKRKTASKTFETESDAALWLSEQRVRHAKDPEAMARQASKTTFAQLVPQWKQARYGGLQPSTRARYDDVVANHLLPYWGTTPVSKISRMSVRDYLTGLQSDGAVKPGTIHKIHTTLSSVLAEGVERGLLATNPAHKLNGAGKLLAPPEPKEPVRLTEAEVWKLADQIVSLPAKAAWASKLSHEPYRVLVLVAAYSGLRHGELVALRRRDIDLDPENPTIHVRRALKSWTPDGPTWGPPKNGKPRDVPIFDEIYDLLTTHLSPGGSPDDLVFTDSNGNAIRRTSFYNKFFAPARDLALPDHADLVFHDLRHQFCSWSLAAGVDLMSVAAWAGHKDASITAVVYAHDIKKANGVARRSLSRGKIEAAVEEVFAEVEAVKVER